MSTHRVAPEIALYFLYIYYGTAHFTGYLIYK